MQTRAGAAVLLVLAAWTDVTALDLVLDARSLDEAIWIGQSRLERDRSRFHAPYRLVVGQPPVDALEIVTPFRRVVLEAETRARAGARLFGHRHAREALGENGPVVDMIVELTFHPHHSLAGVPAYAVALVWPDGRTALPQRVERAARRGPRPDGSLLLDVPAAGIGPGEPFTGAVVAARFDARLLDGRDGATAVVADGDGTVIARVPIALGTLR